MVENMINMDAWVLAFMAKNVITCGIIWKVLGAIAEATPWAVDDKIHQIITGIKLTKG